MMRILFLSAIVWVCLTGGTAFAGHGHHSNGLDGIKAGSPTPEGFYWSMANAYYTADQFETTKALKCPAISKRTCS